MCSTLFVLGLNPLYLCSGQNMFHLCLGQISLLGFRPSFRHVSLSSLFATWSNFFICVGVKSFLWCQILFIFAWGKFSFLSLSRILSICVPVKIFFFAFWWNSFYLCSWQIFLIRVSVKSSCFQVKSTLFVSCSNLHIYVMFKSYLFGFKSNLFYLWSGKFYLFVFLFPLIYPLYLCCCQIFLICVRVSMPVSYCIKVVFDGLHSFSPH